MDLNKDRLQIVYDRKADVLYVTKGVPEHTNYVEYTEDVILRFHPETKQLVGFTLIDFSEALRPEGLRHSTAFWCGFLCRCRAACLRMF